MKDNGQRIQWIDILRGVAVVSVIAAHSVLVYPIDISSKVFFEWLLEVIKTYYMPLFFIISGYVLRKKKYNEFICKKACKLLIPYMLFGVVDICCRQLGGQLVNRKSGLKALLINFLLYGGELWFLYVLFGICLFVPIIYFMCEKYERLIPFEIGLIVLSLFLKSNILCLNSIVYYMFYFTLGQALYLHPSRKRKQIFDDKLLLVGSIFVFCVLVIIKKLYNIEFLILDVILALLGCLIFYRIVTHMKTDRLLTRFFERAGRYSMGIYILQGYCLVITRTVLINGLKMSNPYIIYVLLVVGICIETLIVCEIISRLKPIAYLMGIPYKGKEI